MDVCKAMHKREGALRSTWSLRRFLAAGQDAAAEEGDQRNSQDEQQLFRQADAAFTSTFFWSYVKFILMVNGLVEDLSTWGEACPCHEWQRPACPLRGRRAPECAGGAFDNFLSTTLATVASLFVVCGAGLGEGSSEWNALSSDWNLAVDIICAEVRAKTAHWQQLPWMLAGVAQPDSEKARAVARKCVEKFETVSAEPTLVFGKRHRMTRRFLQRDYEGTRGDGRDVPLRPLLDDFIAGGTLDEEGMAPLREWLGGLRLVRIVERATEDAWLYVLEHQFLLHEGSSFIAASRLFSCSFA